MNTSGILSPCSDRVNDLARKLFFLFFIAVAVINAQTGGKISGIVIDPETNEPLIGCNVLLIGTTMGATTDFEGTYFILNIPAGRYDVQVSILF